MKNALINLSLKIYNRIKRTKTTVDYEAEGAIWLEDFKDTEEDYDLENDPTYIAHEAAVRLEMEEMARFDKWMEDNEERLRDEQEARLIADCENGRPCRF